LSLTFIVSQTVGEAGATWWCKARRDGQYRSALERTGLITLVNSSQAGTEATETTGLTERKKARRRAGKEEEEAEGDEEEEEEGEEEKEEDEEASSSSSSSGEDEDEDEAAMEVEFEPRQLCWRSLALALAGETPMRQGQAIARHVVQHISDPRLLSVWASYDVASNISRALRWGRY
jgi:hypothetical protein